MKEIETPPAVRWIAQTLEEAGFETWAVGGAVRDALVGRPSEDWDIATRAKPTEVRRLFRRTIPIRIDHGTVGVLARDGTLYEVTTFRRDVETTGRHAVVTFSETLDEDLARRDFTINAVAWHPVREVLHDPFGGRGDLEVGILRTVGDPSERFREDYLRVLRALRFAGSFRLRIDGATWRALTAAVPRMGILSAERIREELEKVLGGEPPPSRALALYAASGVLAFLYPELDALVARPRSGGDFWFAHGLRTIDLLPAGRADLRWAALLQGVGKPEIDLGAGEEGRPEAERALLRSAALLTRLRASNARVREVAELAGRVSQLPGSNDDPAALRRWLSGVGRARLSPLLRIWIAAARADAAHGGPVEEAEVRRLGAKLRHWARSGVPLAVEELTFSGRELIRMGYPTGPHFGGVLAHLLDLVLEDPSANDPERLRVEARVWLAGEGRFPRGEGR